MRIIPAYTIAFIQQLLRGESVFEFLISPWRIKCQYANPALPFDTLSILFYRFGLHVYEFPYVAIEILETVLIHEAVVL